MDKFDWSLVKSELTKRMLLITFRKQTDGTMRTMQATLVSDYLPPTTTVKEWPDTLVVVFDAEKEQWRSFHKNSVTSITDSDGNPVGEL